MGATKTYSGFASSTLTSYKTLDLGTLSSVTLLTGTNYNDIVDLSTSTTGFVIAGGNGDDRVIGSAGNDVIWGDTAGNTTSTDNGSDWLSGGNGNDEIHGGNGKDFLFGDGGNDFLYGDNGVDELTGGSGADKLTGGNGADTFIYKLVSDSAGTAGAFNALNDDVITDFRNSDGDKIDLAALNPQLTGASGPTKLTWNGSTAGAHSVWTDGTYLYADTNGDNTADLVIKVSGVTGGSFLGVNHGPLILGPMTGTAIEDAPAATFNLLTGASDSDGDALSVAGVTYSVDGSAPSALAPTGVSISGSTLTVDTANDVFDALGVGESQTIVVGYDVKDIYGAKVHQTETVTVQGVNDVVVISATSDKAGSVFEGDGGANQTATGTIHYTDADAHDVHGFSISSAASNGSAGVDVDGNWTYTVTDSGVVDALAVNETLTDHFAVTVDDGHGGAAVQTVEITITGTNDAVVIGADAEIAGSVSEGDDGSSQTTTGTITFSDVDTSDTHTIAVSAAASYGEASVDSDGKWTYIVTDDGSVDALAVGEHLTDHFDVTIDDGHGGAATRTVEVTITGTNDAPTLTSLPQSGDVTEDGQTLASGNVSATDVDFTDTLHYTSTATSAYGTFAVNEATGDWTYTLANDSQAVQDLTSADHITEHFTVAVSDGHGGAISQDVAVTINGADDTALPPPVPGITAPSGGVDPHDQTQTDGAPPVDSVTYAGPTSVDQNGNIVQGTSGNDIIDAKNGADEVYGLDGNDTLSGGAGTDALYGGTGDDILNGGPGIDHLYGGSGSDVLIGLSENDFLNGGFGADYLLGDEGNDTFVYQNDADRGDFIDTFRRTAPNNVDKIDLSALAIDHFSTNGADGHAVWDFGAGSTVVQGVTYSGEVYAADTDGNTSTIEFWFVVGGSGGNAVTALQASDFVFV